MITKPKQNDWDDSLDFIVGIGSFGSFTATFQDEEPKVKRRIGFIRDAKQASPENTPDRKQKTAKRSPTKRKADRRADRQALPSQNSTKVPAKRKSK